MRRVIELVEGANQRGGRMLSVLDLLDAGTLTVEQTAWLLARVVGGSSWLVGARPGGAGKTTIMAALLAMLPEGSPVHLAIPGSAWKNARAGECVVAYEISPGAYEAYVWGEELRSLAALAGRGCRVVTNLHADTLEEAREQVVRQNGVPEGQFSRFGLFLPIRLRGDGGRARPRVPAIWQHTGEAWRRIDEPPLGPDEQSARAWLVQGLGRRVRSVEQVRSSWLEFLRDGGLRPRRQDLGA